MFTTNDNAYRTPYAVRRHLTNPIASTRGSKVSKDSPVTRTGGLRTAEGL